jgi:Alpha/beta hydrolase of unknown function (DUF900)
VCASTSQFVKLFAPVSNRSSRTLADDKPQLASVTFINPESSLEAFKQSHYSMLRAFTNVITLYVNNNDIALFASEAINQQRQLGKHAKDFKSGVGEDGDEEWLDVDVIDTTDLDTNIQLARHSYFSLNKLVIDDLVEILKKSNRAANRTRVVEIEGNVYRFLAAPAYIVA